MLLRAVGFYLLLVLALAIPVIPSVAYYLAGLIFLLWCIDVLISKNKQCFASPFFYPLVGLAVFSLLAHALAVVLGKPTPVGYLPFLSLFYFPVAGFISSIEKRNMILWTYLTGATLAVGVELVRRWDAMFSVSVPVGEFSGVLAFHIVVALCLLTGFCAEGETPRDKVLYTLIAIPLGLLGALSGGRMLAVMLLIAFLAATVLAHKSLAAPLALALVLTISLTGFRNHGIGEQFNEYSEVVTMPIDDIAESYPGVSEAKFYGSMQSSALTELPRTSSFLVSLVQHSGPPALILFLWVMVEQARWAFNKRRKVINSRTRGFHLAVLLIIVSSLSMNLWGALFEMPSPILATWLILGMAEV